jgi:hypothetical protein
MHPLTLQFTPANLDGLTLRDQIARHDEVDSFEMDYQEQYVLKSLDFVRSALSIVFCFVVIYAIIVSIQNDSNTVFRLVLTGIALLALVFTFTRFFRMFFTTTMLCILIAACAARTLLVTTSGAIGFSMTAIITFLVREPRLLLFVLMRLSLFRLAEHDLRCRSYVRVSSSRSW